MREILPETKAKACGPYEEKKNEPMPEAEISQSLTVAKRTLLAACVRGIVG